MFQPLCPGRQGHSDPGVSLTLGKYVLVRGIRGHQGHQGQGVPGWAACRTDAAERTTRTLRRRCPASSNWQPQRVAARRGALPLYRAPQFSPDIMEVQGIQGRL
jgi:hypothetical protein